MDPDEFVGHLSTCPSTSVYFNPWFGDDHQAAACRANLLRYLKDHERAEVLVVGEAPGYLGARLSGVPFTDPRHLGGKGREQSASAVQEFLERFSLHDKVLLWNVFPFHPHLPDRPGTNRVPRAHELRQGLPFLHALRPEGRALVIGLGRKAVQGLVLAGIDAPYVPHPRPPRGPKFRAALESLLSARGFLPGSS